MAIIGNRAGIIYFGQVTSADTMLPGGVVPLTADRTESPTADNVSNPETFLASSTFF